MSDIHIMQKGAPISIAEKSPGLKKLFVGMGWDVNTQGGADYDLDLTVVLAGADKKLKEQKNLLYYGNLEYKVGNDVVVQHSADNLTGAGDGDDEWFWAKLDQLPQDIQHIFIIVNIYEAGTRNQHFGNVESSFVRLADGDTDKEFAKHELKNEFANNSGVLVAEIYRMGGEWKANVIAKGVNGSIEEILKAEGIE